MIELKSGWQLEVSEEGDVRLWLQTESLSDSAELRLIFNDHEISSTPVRTSMVNHSVATSEHCCTLWESEQGVSMRGGKGCKYNTCSVAPAANASKIIKSCDYQGDLQKFNVFICVEHVYRHNMTIVAHIVLLTS